MNLANEEFTKQLKEALASDKKLKVEFKTVWYKRLFKRKG